MARKSDYDTKVRPRLAEIEEWAKNGLTNKQIARNLRISEKSLYNYMEQYEALVIALEKGKDVLEYEAEGSLLKLIRGFEYEEEQVTKEGVMKVKKYSKPNFQAIQFWLTNRKYGEWKNKQDIEQRIEGSIEHEITTKEAMVGDKEVINDILSELISNEKD